MKIRTDFVTNSSSSSFIIARKEELSEYLKEMMAEFVMNEMLGEKILSPESTEEEILRVFDEQYIDYEERKQSIRKALKEGKSIYYGWVRFDECGYDYVNLLECLWEH